MYACLAQETPPAVMAISLLCLLHQAYHKRTDEMEKLTIPIDVLLSFFLFVRSSSGEKQALPYLTLFKINENTEYIYINIY